MTTDLSPEARQPSWEDCMALLDKLPQLDLEERARAIEELIRNPSPGVRGRVLQVGAAVLPDDKLVDFLRNDADAILRNAALEILKLRGPRSFALAVELLEDEDPDIVLHAVILLGHLKDPRAFEALRTALKHSEPNVVQEAIVAVGRLGDARAIEFLLPFLSNEIWVRMAAIQALGDIRSEAAVEPLNELLADLVVGPLAAEALARIGGDAAFRSLSAHWLRFQDELDPDTTLGLLAHVLEGLSECPETDATLRASFSDRLRDPYRTVRQSTARCLLSLGPGPEDAEALTLLASSVKDDNTLLPSCLNRRADLVNTLLQKPGLPRSWGFYLAAQAPESASPQALVDALGPDLLPESMEAAIGALRDVTDPSLSERLLDLYLALPSCERSSLAPLLEEHREDVAKAVANRKDLSEIDRLVLLALLGEPVDSLVPAVQALSNEDRLEVVSRLDSHNELVRQLPWTDWLESDPATYGEPAARVAIDTTWRELLPALRPLLHINPLPELIRAAGELGDREAVPLLIDLFESEDPIRVALVVETLGKIGGPDARRELRRFATQGEEKLARLAFKALAACATQEDDDFFQEAANHTDWFVRLAAAEVLGRFSRSENMAALSQLAADPVAAVAEKAASMLEG